MPYTHWHGRDSHAGLPYKDKGIFTLLQSDASTTTVAFPGVKAEFLGAPGHFPLPISGNSCRSLSLQLYKPLPGSATGYIRRCPHQTSARAGQELPPVALPRPAAVGAFTAGMPPSACARENPRTKPRPSSLRVVGLNPKRF